MTDITPWNTEKVRAEWIILADHAEVVNNKLYLMGGGWDRLNVQRLPRTFRLSLAVSFLVPWNETNKVHNIDVDILTQDGEGVQHVDGQLEVGRPAGIPPGQVQRLQLGMTIELTLVKVGTYEARAGTIGGQDPCRTIFTVANLTPP